MLKLIEKGETMETLVETMHRQHFVGATGVLLEWYATVCDAEVAHTVREQKTKLRGIVVGSEERERELIHTWHERMSVALPGKVKYAAALRRILGIDGCAYHACEYSDMPAILSVCDDFETVQSLGLDAFLNTCSAEERKTLWELLKQLNGHALHYHGVALTVPTRDDIQANIRVHKAAKAPQRPAMARGFEAAIEELVAAMGAKPNAASDWAMDDAQAAWADAAAAHDLARAVRERDIEAWRTAEFAHDGLRNLFDCAPDESFDDAWPILEKLNSLATVQAGIPPKMMKNIESTAHKLASEIACGKTDMANINLAELGQSVISQCDISDVEAIANNMGTLLPMLQGLSQQK